KATPLLDAHAPRSQIARVACARRVAPHDQLLLGTDLDLEPGRHALAGLVAAIAPLGDDPLEVSLPRGFVESDPLALDVCCVADPRVLPQHALEKTLPMLEWHVEQQLPIEIDQVECLVHERCPTSLFCLFLGRGTGHPLQATGRPTADGLADAQLKQPEIGTAILVECDDLPVHDGLLGL